MYHTLGLPRDRHVAQGPACVLMHGLVLNNFAEVLAVYGHVPFVKMMPIWILDQASLHANSCYGRTPNSFPNYARGSIDSASMEFGLKNHVVQGIGIWGRLIPQWHSDWPAWVSRDLTLKTWF